MVTSEVKDFGLDQEGFWWFDWLGPVWSDGF